MGNMFGNIKELGKLRQQAVHFQKLLQEKIVDVSSPKGEIKLKVNGKMEMLKVEIDPGVLVPEKKQYLEKLFVKTWASAQKEVERLVSTEMKSSMQGMF